MAVDDVRMRAFRREKSVGPRRTERGHEYDGGASSGGGEEVMEVVIPPAGEKRQLQSRRVLQVKVVVVG